jgi:hypothetical protein
MSRKREPEVALALAILKRVVDDVKLGSASNRRRARADIAAGGLDYWIEVVAESCDGAEVIRRELRKLVGLDQPAKPPQKP